MSQYITDLSFYKYLKCPSWIARDARQQEEYRNVLLEKIQQDGLLRENELALLREREITEVKAEDIDEAAQETLEMMKNGVQTIYKGVLVHGRWVGRPDILERVEGKSKLGDWYYVACDIKRSSHLKDEYKFQGSFYAEILKKIQGVSPVQGYVIHANGESESYLLEDFYTRFHLTLDAIEDILDNETEPHFLTSGCKQSPYFSECSHEAQECDDLSLLNRVWRSEVDLLIRANITTVSELADATPEQLAKVSGLSMDRLYFLQQQALSLIEDKVIRLGEIDLPEEDGVALIIDIESDPLRDLDYLFGVLVADAKGETYHPFLAKTKAGEERAWRNLVEFLRGYEGANIYHYGWYEVDVFRKLVEKYNAPIEVKQMFENNMIDLLTRMRERIIFPMPFFSLKDIAKYLGFHWRIEDASGLDSILWYEEWLEKGDEKVLQDIVDYNEDDVRATWYLRNWLVNKKD